MPDNVDSMCTCVNVNGGICVCGFRARLDENTQAQCHLCGN